MADRIRAVLATISSAPWRRAPWLLWRRPGVLVTVAGACAVMAASVAAVPLYLSSVGSESVDLQVAERCPRDTGAMLAIGPTASAITSPSPDPFVAVADQLGPSSRWARVLDLELWGADPSKDMPASLLVRDGALDHVDVVAGEPGPGVWISDRAAATTGLAVGDQATLAGVEVPITGVFRDLPDTTVDDYWCSNADMVLLEVRGPDLVAPPALVIADPATFADLMGELDVDRAHGAWEAPLRPGLTVSDTRSLVDELACEGDGGAEPSWCTGGRPLIPRSSRSRFSTEPVEAEDAADFVERYLHSHLPFVTERSEAIGTSVGAGIWPMAGLGALAGVGLVAAAASLWFDRRRREVTLLTVRGVSPAGLGAKAVLELSGPLLVGVGAGMALAYGMVVWLGPSPRLEPGAFGQAAVGSAAALLGAAVTVAAVVARRVRSHAVRARRRIPVAALPWELLLGWATVVSYRRLGDWGVPVGKGADVSRVDVAGLLFPVLFLVTAVAVLSRVLALALRPLRAASRSWPIALHLGIRRVARYRVAILGLVAASAIAAGVLGYATTMNRSLDATLQAKASTFVGSDTAVRIAADEPIPPVLADRATEVLVHWRGWIDDGGRTGVAVIAIDPSTFERAAFWDDSFAGAPLGDILDRLAAVPAGGPIPAVVVGLPVDGPTELIITETRTEVLTIERLADVPAFPGTKRGKPTVFVARSALEGLDLGAGDTEAWIRGDREETLDALTAAGVRYSEGRRLAEVADSASFLTVSWTFGFMQSLGLSAGLLVLGAVAVYLDARRRDRLLGYAFMRRMGLSRRQHRRALGVELTASVLVGCWVGLVVALAAAGFASPRIDPVPGFRPDPLLRPAIAVVTAMAVTALVVAVIAAVVGQRRIDRDDPVEVLRAGV